MFLPFFFVCLLLTTLINASDVVEITNQSEFDDVIDGSSHVLLELYAPWCGHCKNLAPEYEKVATAFKDIPDVILAKIDATAVTEIADALGVTGYPTLFWYKKGSTTKQPFDGRTADAIIDSINQQAGTRVKIVKPVTAVNFLTESNFDSIALDPTKDVMVEFFAPWCGHCKAFAPEYEKAAAAFAGDDSVVIAAVDATAHRSLGSRYGVTGYPTVKWFPKNDKSGDLPYNSERTVEGVVNFVNAEVGTARNPDGTLQASAGRHPDLDSIANDFISASEDARAQIIESATQVLNEISDSASSFEKVTYKYYLRVMNKVVSSGSEYITKQNNRISKLVQSSNLSPSKLDELRGRLNVLAAFR